MTRNWLDLALQSAARKHLPFEWELAQIGGRTIFPAIGPEGYIVGEYLADIRTRGPMPDGKFYHYTFVLPDVDHVEAALLEAMDKFKESLAEHATKG